ncbi:MAG: hypothetical protein LBO62_06035 [Endomicrobium sp.]|jgi:hypothetical protein|nr:hypothetical protein [Endomicrobium sp.]
MFEIIGIISIVSALAAYLITSKIAVTGIGVLLLALLIYCLASLFIKRDANSKTKMSNISVIPLLIIIILFIAIKITYLME